MVFKSKKQYSGVNGGGVLVQKNLNTIWILIRGNEKKDKSKALIRSIRFVPNPSFATKKLVGGGLPISEINGNESSHKWSATYCYCLQIWLSLISTVFLFLHWSLLKITKWSHKLLNFLCHGVGVFYWFPPYLLLLLLRLQHRLLLTSFHL